jgi:hypothetical protein
MKLLSILLVIVPGFSIAQHPIKEFKPSDLWPLDLSAEGAEKFKSDQELYYKISRKLSQGVKRENLSEDERKILDETDETVEDYWEILGAGCSWYCGGGPSEVTASSSLKPQGTNSYDGGNAESEFQNCLGRRSTRLWRR